MTTTMLTTASASAPPGSEPEYQYRSDASEWGLHPGVVSFARRRARLLLAEWGLEELEQEASQIVSELVTNALESHERERLEAPVRLTLIAGLGPVLLIVVRDFSAAMPIPSRPADDDESGRGLLIVQTLSDHWSVKRCQEGGKAVRVLLRGQRR